MGVIMRTAAYMSPEQARGKTIDRRTDTWAFGVLLYEMLAAQRPFDGPTVSEVLAQVLEREPDLDSLLPTVPRPITTLVRRCLSV